MNLRRYDEYMIMNMLIFDRSNDNIMILSCDKVMIAQITLGYDCSS